MAPQSLPSTGPPRRSSPARRQRWTLRLTVGARRASMCACYPSTMPFTARRWSPSAMHSRLRSPALRRTPPRPNSTRPLRAGRRRAANWMRPTGGETCASRCASPPRWRPWRLQASTPSSNYRPTLCWLPPCTRRWKPAAMQPWSPRRCGGGAKSAQRCLRLRRSCTPAVCRLTGKECCPPAAATRRCPPTPGSGSATGSHRLPVLQPPPVRHPCCGASARPVSKV